MLKKLTPRGFKPGLPAARILKILAINPNPYIKAKRKLTSANQNGL